MLCMVKSYPLVIGVKNYFNHSPIFYLYFINEKSRPGIWASLYLIELAIFKLSYHVFHPKNGVLSQIILSYNL